MLHFSASAMFILLLSLSTQGWANQFTKEVKQSSHETKEAFKQTGKTIKEDAQKAGKETKDAFKQTGKDIKHGAQKVGAEIKEGTKRVGHELRDTFKK